MLENFYAIHLEVTDDKPPNVDTMAEEQHIVPQLTIDGVVVRAADDDQFVKRWILQYSTPETGNRKIWNTIIIDNVQNAQMDGPWEHVANFNSLAKM